jgi:ribosome biogenesis GTPase
LIALPDRRGLLIDTPGMRELQLWAQTDTARDSFDDILQLAQGCHFTNCRHRDEPRCAVKSAVADGKLAAERLDAFLKFQDELQSLDARRNVREQIDAKRKTRPTSQSPKKIDRSQD